MSKQVIIYWKNIQFCVVIPQEKIYNFIAAFGEEFKIDCHDDPCDKMPKPIDRYEPHQAGWHIWVSVHVSQEQKFYDFLARFCEKEYLPLRQDDLKPGQS